MRFSLAPRAALAFIRVSLAGIIISSCGGGSSLSSSGFALVVGNDESDETLSLEAPMTKTIGLFVLGADAKTVSISVDEPPSFVTLKGALLQLSPTIKDAGDYVVTLKAVADHQTATGTLRLHVTRTNTPPFVLPQPRIVQTAAGSEAEAVVCDNEGDDIIFRIEVAPVGQQLTGTATPLIR